MSIRHRTSLLAVGLGLLVGQTVHAHPMGNFAICHYTRLLAQRDRLHVRYILDLAEIPTVGEKKAIDRDKDGKISADEKAAYLAAKTPELLAGLSLLVNGQPVLLRSGSGEVVFTLGAAGLDTMKH